jgi:hypothetical protein
MSILSRPLIADTMARTIASTVGPAAKSTVSFPELARAAVDDDIRKWDSLSRRTDFDDGAQLATS